METITKAQEYYQIASCCPWAFGSEAGTWYSSMHSSHYQNAKACARSSGSWQTGNLGISDFQLS